VTTATPDTRVVPSTTDGDHDRFAHYVKKDHILRAAVEGKPAVALCGKKWIPDRDPTKYPVCPACQKIMEMIRARGKKS
jgi:hypothetical protein